MQPEMRGALTPRGSSGPSPRLSQVGWNERVHLSEQFNYKRYLRRCQRGFWRLCVHGTSRRAASLRLLSSLRFRIARKIRRNAQMSSAPTAQDTHGLDEFLPGSRQGICDLRRRSPLHLAMDDAVCFHLAKLRSEYLFADTRQKSAQFSKALRAESQMPDGEHFPLAAQGVDRPLYGTPIMILHRRLQAYKIVRTSSSPHMVIPF